MDDRIIIQLSKQDLFLAAMIGVLRRITGMGKPDRPGLNGRTWETDCNGACGELATAKWLNVFYDGALGNFKARDAGPLQVRTTPYETGCLLLQPEDDDDDIFVLVLAFDQPRFDLRGWLRGREGKQKKWWNPDAPYPCYFVPQTALRSMLQLKTNNLVLA